MVNLLYQLIIILRKATVTRRFMMCVCVHIFDVLFESNHMYIFHGAVLYVTVKLLKRRFCGVIFGSRYKWHSKCSRLGLRLPLMCIKESQLAFGKFGVQWRTTRLCLESLSICVLSIVMTD